MYTHIRGPLSSTFFEEWILWNAKYNRRNSLKPELAHAFAEKFHLELYEGFGCTELSPVVAVGTPSFSGHTGPRDSRQVGHKTGTVGHPIPGVAVRIVNADSFEDLGPGHDDLLLVQGPSVMMGYLGEPEKTRQAFYEEGWYVTGDIARLDEDGFLTITDRISRFSKIGGEMVPHLQVENALHQALDANEPRFVVTSVADDQKGEKLVVLHTELGVPVDELLRRLRGSSLPRLWLPRRENFIAIDALPVLGSGKLDLKRVKEIARERAAMSPPLTAKPAG